jgi:hypothetical protein
LNDYSEDVAINDFYYNVYQLLPEGSALVGRGGVFGYDMFYFRYVYGVRPDVQIPMAEPPGEGSPRGLKDAVAVYTTVPATQGQRPVGRWAPPPELLGSKTWAIPVLVGESPESSFNQARGSLVLYELTDHAPQVVVAEAEPDHELGIELNGLTLVGYDLEEERVERGGRLHLTLYWQVSERNPPLVVTAIDGVQVERHQLGFGNLEKYVEEFRPPRDSVVVEDYWLVVPSNTRMGDVVLQVGTASPLPSEDMHLVDLATLEVESGGYFSLPIYRGRLPWGVTYEC